MQKVFRNGTSHFGKSTSLAGPIGGFASIIRLGADSVGGQAGVWCRASLVGTDLNDLLPVLLLGCYIVEGVSCNLGTGANH